MLHISALRYSSGADVAVILAPWRYDESRLAAARREGVLVDPRPRRSPATHSSFLRKSVDGRGLAP
jgi:hypothetical protein